MYKPTLLLPPQGEDALDMQIEQQGPYDSTTSSMTASRHCEKGVAGVSPSHHLSGICSTEAAQSFVCNITDIAFERLHLRIPESYCFES